MSPQLGHEVIGSGEHVVVFAHGFTQTRASWRNIATQLSSVNPTLRCILVDLPGHGDSHHVSVGFSETAELLTNVGGPATYVGYSLGGRVVLQAAVNFPTMVRHAVVVSATGGIDDDALRTQRAIDDAMLADRILAIGIDTFLDEWLAQPLFADLPRDIAQHDDRRSNNARGLADSLRRCGQGAQLPLWNALSTLSAPLVAIAGARDTKFIALARRLAAIAPHGALQVIPDAGHSAHLQQPAAVVAELLYRLNYWIASPRA